MRALALIMITLAMSAAAWGQAQPAVRAEVKPESVIVGEPVELTVTVLVPTWFTRPPVYPTFELANAITRLPADNSYPIRERVGNESWSGIVRTYEIYPLMGASYRMAGQAMRITFANPGSDAITVEVEVPEVVLRGVVPEGAESLDPYLAGRSLELSIDVAGEPDGLEAGDALVLTYRAELDGLPAIFLPPLAPDLEFDGVAVYRDMPEVEDGDTARRTEKLTLVFEAGGEFSVPSRTLTFWNTASRSIETATAEGLAVSVEGPPVAVIVDGEATKDRWQQFVAMLVGSIASILFLWRVVPGLVRRCREAAEQRRQTENYAFRQLLGALGSGDSAAAYRALLHWIERLEPGMGVRAFAVRYGGNSLSEAITGLSAGLYGDADGSADLRQVGRQLKLARRHYLEKDSVTSTSQLPPLNP